MTGRGQHHAAGLRRARWPGRRLPRLRTPCDYLTRQAGLTGVHAEERPVDVGVTEPGQLVRYRLGHPVFAGWLDEIGPVRAAAFTAATEQAIRDEMRPYRPLVIFLSARAAA
jgi:hypothetical protein